MYPEAEIDTRIFCDNSMYSLIECSPALTQDMDLGKDDAMTLR